VGGHAGFDLERIAALKPDLIVAWPMGGERQLHRLESLGIPIFRSAPTRLEQIGRSLLSLGKLLGKEASAQHAQQQFEEQLQTLRQQYAHRRVLRVFYQAWSAPLMTLGGQHTISDALQVCGAQNLFADLHLPAPSVSQEAVLQRHPDLVIVNAAATTLGELKNTWKQVPIVVLKNDALTRPVPRMLEAVGQMCESIDQVRQGRQR
jgi:iron complex transport system substrate-binding protein